MPYPEEDREIFTVYREETVMSFRAQSLHREVYQFNLINNHAETSVVGVDHDSQILIQALSLIRACCTRRQEGSPSDAQRAIWACIASRLVVS